MKRNEANLELDNYMIEIPVILKSELLFNII